MVEATIWGQSRMSLINEVLQDLDKKAPVEHQNSLGLMDGGDTSGAKRVNKLLLLVLILLTLIAAAALVLAYQSLYGDKPVSVQSTETVQVVTTKTQAAPVALVVPQKPQPVVPAQINTPETVEVIDVIDARSIEAKAIEPNPIEAKTVETKATEAKVIQAEVVEATVIESTVIESTAVESKLVSAATPESSPKVIEPKAEILVSSQVNQVELAPQPRVATADPVEEQQTSQRPSLISDYQMDKQKTQIDLDYDKALALYRAKQYKASEQQIDAVLAQEASPRYMALKARLLYRQGPQVLIHYIDQENLDIGISDEILALSANAFQRQGDHLRALKAYDLLVQRQPSESKWWMAMGVSLETLKAYKKAEKTYSMALETGQLPANARAFTVKQLNQVKKALAEQQRLAEEQ